MMLLLSRIVRRRKSTERQALGVIHRQGRGALSTRTIDLWAIPTTSSGAFPEARRDPNKFRGARKADR